MKNSLFIVAFFFIYVLGRAQNNETPDINNDWKASYDTSYIKTFKHFINIENSIGRSGLNVIISERKGNHIRFSINQKTQLGFKLNWRFINFSFGVTIPFFNNDFDKFGQTKGYNFNFATQLKRSILLDVFF